MLPQKGETINMKRILKWLTIALLTFSLALGIHTLLPVQAESTPAALVQTGKQHYDAGQFTEAAQVLRQASIDDKDPLKQAQILGLLSLTYQKLGQWDAAKAAIASSLQRLANYQDEHDLIRAQVWNAQAHLQFATGNAEAALETWQKTQIFYAKAQDKAGTIGSQINQAQALQVLGFYRRTQQLLEEIQQQVLQLGDSPLKVAGLHTLGNFRRQGGELVQAEKLLTVALTTAQKITMLEEASRILISLGNTEHALANRLQDFDAPEVVDQHLQQALAYYQQAVTIAPTALTRTQAYLNQFNLQVEINPSTLPLELVARISTEIEQLPPSRATIEAQVHFAHNLLQLQQNQLQVSDLLETAVHQAEVLQDQRAISYALGTLGALYEQKANWSKATEITGRALQISQAIIAPDLSYQWQWQLGRLQQAQEAKKPNQSIKPGAIAYYRQALQTLKTLRSDLVALNPEIQFSFRERVEPLYRQYVDLLLREAQPSIANLIEARNTIEALQLAELDNFFQDACARPLPVNVDDLDPNAAIVYPILLPDRLEVILKLPGKDNLQHSRHSNVSEAQVDQAVVQLRRSLRRRSTSLNQIKQDAQQFYDWLLQPFEAEFTSLATQPSDEIKTLVFVLDGSLRNVPPALLYDGKQYLIERYAVAVTPSLQLLAPKPLQRQTLNALIGGATNAPSFAEEGLEAIDNVAIELTGIAAEVNRSQKLENQQFVQENIQSQIHKSAFNIVHIATHGQFSSNPEQTFILDWNKRIQVKDLDTLLRSNNQLEANPIELLVLSACETAIGDKRAALGLAGIAIRAGARSTLATLVQVNDESTAQLMIEFYKQLSNPKLTKAEALRQAQLSLLYSEDQGIVSEFARPYFWAPFILVGNWL
jgi:CHAT domain-containing protein